MRCCAITLLVLMLSACGQRGPLYFPEGNGGAAPASASTTPGTPSNANDNAHDNADDTVSDREDNDD